MPGFIEHGDGRGYFRMSFGQLKISFVVSGGYFDGPRAKTAIHRGVGDHGDRATVEKGTNTN